MGGPKSCGDGEIFTWIGRILGGVWLARGRGGAHFLEF